ncbi:ATP synthase F1 subunit epsilon [Candidatus Peregrinibacteria bacterium]|jgi:F-type H+-transporting ATPase subunit epsilon|nr:ATP synthase F1 subunit epsilon [Candidatus Peregrinibacteria bacterium]MBT4055518.1 ATP synthase F1 subunit epsilon [Candidatus Peregrinibacteria bacterium]
MSHKTIELKIITPGEILLREEVEGVSFPTVEGEITILPEHIPIIAAIKPGEVKIKKDGKERFFSIARGVLEVDGKSITLLTDAAERPDDIDEKRAEEARKKAKELMSEKRRGEEGYAEAVAQLERAMSRVRIAKRRKARGRSTIDSN